MQRLKRALLYMFRYVCIHKQPLKMSIVLTPIVVAWNMVNFLTFHVPLAHDLSVALTMALTIDLAMVPAFAVALASALHERCHCQCCNALYERRQCCGVQCPRVLLRCAAFCHAVPSQLHCAMKVSDWSGRRRLGLILARRPDGERVTLGCRVGCLL